MVFRGRGRREVVASFDGGTISSDGGVLLLREVDGRLKLMERLSRCFSDERSPLLIKHRVDELVAQRVYALALGYADLNDHEQLREDPLLAVVAGKLKPGEQALAGKSTLNRLERSAGRSDRYHKIHYDAQAIDRLLVKLFIEAHRRTPEDIVIDLDTTDLALHGEQEGRFFHGFYDSYCYLPLYIFCGEHLLGVRLRTANQDAAAGCLEEIERIVTQIRAAWPKVRIVVRADSGFCRDELMRWCEASGVEYVLGLARNKRLRGIVEKPMRKAKHLQRRTDTTARVFTEFKHETTTGSWSRRRRVVAKCEQLPDKENPRYVVTSLSRHEWPARALYEKLYCARGEMENRIKEQMSLFAERVSAATMRANQLRLYLSAMAYVLMHGLRRLALAGTEFAKAQAQTIRLKLLKIGAQVRVSVRKVWISMASSYPHQALFETLYQRLRI
jgi:transposase InsO family protein